MYLDNQVTSLELSKKLQSLNLSQQTIFYWILAKSSKNIAAYGLTFVSNIFDRKDTFEEIFSAYTASELGELLPNRVFLKDKEPFDSYTISIKKFYTVDEDRTATNNYILNYECDSTSIAGEDAWLSRKLCKNIYNPNLADAMAEMLIFLIENKLIEEINENK